MYEITEDVGERVHTLESLTLIKRVGVRQRSERSQVSNGVCDLHGEY